MNRHSPSRASAVAEVARALENIEERVRAEVASQLVDALSREVADTTPDRRLRVKNWAIRNDDLDLVRTAASAIAGAAGASLVTPSTSAKAVSSLVLGAVSLLRAIRAKSIHLTEEQATVIAVLKASRHGLSDVELRAVLNDFTANQVRHHLSQLARVARSDGTVIALVEQSADGRWHAAGV